MSVSNADSCVTIDSRSDAVETSDCVSSAFGYCLVFAARVGCCLTTGGAEELCATSTTGRVDPCWDWADEAKLAVSLLSASISSGDSPARVPVTGITSDMVPTSVSVVYSIAE